MNYGKTAYLKVIELEKEISFSNSEQKDNHYLEISKPNINESFDNNSKIIVELPKFNVEREKTICFQIKATFSSSIDTKIKSSLFINQTLIHEEDKSITNGEIDIVIFKTFTPISSNEISSKIEFLALKENSKTTLKSIGIIILGANGNSISSQIEMRALSLNNNKVLVSYIDDSKLYYCNETIEEKSISSNNFFYLKPALSHCFCFINDTEQPILYYCNTNNVLFVSTPFNEENKEFELDRNVNKVFACVAPKISEYSNIIVYIKDGDCFYTCVKENLSFTKPKKLPLPVGKYNDIQIISHPESDFVFVFASHENGSNYIIRSQIDVSTERIIENLTLTYELAVSKYLDISKHSKNPIENIKLNIEHLIYDYIDYQSLFDRVSKEKINLTYSLDVNKYTIEKDFLYGIKLDKNNLIAGEWESYTDDATDFLPAYMDFDNDVFVDNGWLDRWPYNEIKPCILKNGEVVGYLNPNDYTQFEDGSPAPITNKNYGDVMIEIPKIYYKLSSDDNYDYIQISKKAREGFTDNAFWHSGHDNDKIYVGAYLSGDIYITDSGLFSNSGIKLNDLYAFNHTRGYTYKSQYNSPNMELLPFNVLTLIQCLYLIMFKNTNSQACLGYGIGALTSAQTTGHADKKGMYYGQNQKQTSIKCFGLEDLYGVRNTIVTGLILDTNGYPKYIDVYNPNSNYKPDAINDYIKSENAKVFANGKSGTLMTISGVNEFGFINQVDGTQNETLGFTDFCYPLKNASFIIYGTIQTNEHYGIFNTKFCRKDTTNSKWNFRLVYYPNLNS